MNKFKMWFSNFMRGRYGADTMYWWSLGGFVLLWVLELVFSILRIGIVVSILNLLSTALVVYAVFRFFSRNVYKRSAENRRFCEFLRKTKLDLVPNRFRDRKTHVYKTCPACKASLRLPRSPGEHTVRCPKCSERFNIKI